MPVSLQAGAERAPQSRRPGRRTYLLATLFAAALVLLPFLFWYDTWFGRQLSDGKIDEYLADAGKPRRTQQALIQIGERMTRGDASARRWYPRIIELTKHANPELRQTAAWIMGQDAKADVFRGALAPMLADPVPLVRRNAALSLSAFRDPAGRAELQTMLRPFTLAAPAAGPLKYRLNRGEYVNTGTLIARIGDVEVRSPVPGEMRDRLHADNTGIQAGQPLAEIGADEAHVWEALRALFLVGAGDDVENIQRFARGVPGMSPRVQKQAALTLERIRTRP